MDCFLDPFFSLALTLEAVGIPDSNLRSSSSQNGYEVWRGRLHGDRSWKPDKRDRAPYLNITLPSSEDVTYIATQGSPDGKCWTTTFRIYYKMQGGSLKQYPEVCNIVTGVTLSRDFLFLIDI